MSFRAGIFMLTTCLLFSPGAYSNTAQEEVAIARSGNTVVRAPYDKKTVEITIRTIRLDKSNCAFPFSAFPWNLKEWEFKEITIVKSLEILVGGQKLFVPWSVFADLINPLKASLGFEKGFYVLTVSGGDAGDSYFIRVYFDTEKVSRKKCYSALDKALTSDTRYYQPVL